MEKCGKSGSTKEEEELCLFIVIARAQFDEKTATNGAQFFSGPPMPMNGRNWREGARNMAN